MLWQTVPTEKENEGVVYPGRKTPGENAHLYSVINLRLKLDTNIMLFMTRGMEVSMCTCGHTCISSLKNTEGRDSKGLYITCAVC